MLAKRQRLAGRDAKLPFDEIEPGHRLGDRVLDLQPRVHLDEIERTAFGDEFDSAGADIADRARRGDRGFPHRVALLGGEPGRRRLLDHLLMPALDRAIALEQMDRVAVPVGEDLDLDMARRRSRYFSIRRRSSPKAALASRRAPASAPAKSAALADDPHTAPAAAGGGLDQHRKADPFGLVEQPSRRSGRRRDSPARAAPRAAPSAPWPRPSIPWRGSPRPAGR